MLRAARSFVVICLVGFTLSPAQTAPLRSSSDVPTMPAAPMREQDRDTLVIHTTTRLVQLNVVVLDKQGRPVSGLSPDDFQVLENGREQKLIHFSAINTPILVSRADASPLVISNRLPGQREASTVTVILVDELIDQEITAIAARHAIQSIRLEVLKFLSTLQPSEQVALYALRPEGVVIVHDFTDAPAELVTAAKKTPKPLAGSSSSSEDIVNERIRRMQVDDAFQGIARQLQGVPGRKNLVWISAEFPSMVSGFDPGLMFAERDTGTPVAGAHAMLPVPQYASPENYHDQLRALARSLSHANVSVYPIDARGLMGGAPMAMQSGPSMPMTFLSGSGKEALNAGAALPPTGPVTAPYLGQWSAMDQIASETGGRAFYNTNAIGKDMREVVDESRVTYMLGYYPGDSAWDGKYHKVEVKLKREGLIAHCRKGYFAVDEKLDNPDHALREVARSALDASRIGVTLNVSSNPLEWGPQDVVVKVDTHGIDFQQSEGRWKAQLDIAFANVAKDGRVLGGDKDHVDLALYPETYSDASALGWMHPKNVYVYRAAERLRVVVRDLATGATGSVSVPVRHDEWRH